MIGSGLFVCVGFVSLVVCCMLFYILRVFVCLVSGFHVWFRCCVVCGCVDVLFVL